MMPENGSRFYLKSADKLFVKSSLKTVSLYNFHCSINTFDCSVFNHFYCMWKKQRVFRISVCFILQSENVYIIVGT